MNDPLLEDEIDTEEEEDTDGPNIDNFVSDPIITLRPAQVLPQSLQLLVDDTKRIIQERRDKMFGSEEEPTPEPEPVPQEPVQGPKEKLPSINFTEKALDVLEKAPDLFTGLDELTKTYNSAEWDNPAEATKDLEDYGKALRQRFKISTLPEEYTFDLAPVKPSEIASEYDDPVDNTIDRTQKWKEANLKFLDETTDPQLIAKRDILKRSIIEQANKIEGEIRGKSRDEYYTGFISNLGINAAKGLINPFHELATGKQYTGLERYLDPARAEGFSTDVGMITGGVAGFLGVAGVAAAGGAAPLAAGLVAGAAQGIGPVRERFNFIEDETGSSDQALTGAAIETAAQIAYNVPAGFLASKAIKGATSFLSQTAEQAVKEEVTQKTIQKIGARAANKELAEGIITGVGGAGVGTLLTNESLRVGLDTNDISLFQGLDKSLIYGGLLGAGAGYMGGGAAAKDAMLKYAIKNYDKMPPVDTALYAQEVSAKGKQADIDRGTGKVRGEVTTSEDRSPDSTPTKKTSRKENVFGEGTPRKRGKKIVREKDGTEKVVDTESPIPKPDELKDLDFPEITIPKPEPDSVTNYDKSINGDDFVGTAVEGISDDVPSVSTKGGLSELSDKILILSGKNFSDIGMAPGGLTLLNHTFGAMLQDPEAFAKIVKLMPQKPGIYGEAVTNFVDTPYIRVSKDLFSDPIKMLATMSHEPGHFIDFLNAFVNTLDPKANSELYKYKVLINRLAQVKSQFAQPEGLSWKVQRKAEEQAMAVSAHRRGEWRNLPEDSPHRAYRSRPEEIFADVFGAWAVQPEILNKYPDLVRALDDGFTRLGRTNPGLKRFYDWYKANRDNSNWVQQIRSENTLNVYRAGFEKENLTNKLNAAKDLTLYEKGVDAIKSLYTTIFNRNFQIEFDLKQAPIGERPYLEGLVDTVRKSAYLHDFIFEKINNPLKHLLENTDEAFKASGHNTAEGIASIGRLLEANKTINDSTAAIESIKADPDRFKQALAPLLASLDSRSSDLSIRPFLREGYIQALEKAVAESDPEAFVNVMARMSFETQLAGEELTPSASRRKVREARKTSNSKEVLKRIKKVQKLFPQFKNDLSVLFDPNSYRIRKYMANRGGDVIFNANEDIAKLQAKYGKDYAILENFSKDFYKIMSTLDPYVESSGLYTPEVIQKMKINRDSYVTNAALEYFTSYSQFGPQIKAALGSLKQTIEPISATTAKKNVMIVAAAHQTAENALVDLAVGFGYEVKDVGIRSAKEIFKSINSLKRDSPRDAFLVKYTDGKPQLFQVTDGRLLESSIRKTESGPAVEGVLSFIEAGNKLFMIRELRTAYSPAFVLLQKFRDRKREFLSVLSNETLNPIKAAKIVYDVNFGEGGTKKATQNYFESEGRVVQPGDFGNALENQVNPNPLFGYGAPERDFNLAIEKVGELLDRPADPDTSFAARIHDVANRKLLESNILGRNVKRFAEVIKSTAEQDEFRAKTNGYILAKRYGFSDANAAHFARLGFGNPDPRGGGTASTELNKIFLFGRDYLNGIRSMGLHLSTNPKQAMATQFLCVVAPKLLVTTAGAQLIGGLLGGEDGAEVYKKWVQKVASFDKQSKLMLPVGFQNSVGELKLMGEVSAKDIGNNWKAVGIGIPQDPIETDVAKFAWPFIDEVLNNWTGNIATRSIDSVTNMATSIGARVNPALQWMYNIAAFSIGKEPYDLYRNKGIYPKDIQLGGSTIDKAKYFAGYQASQMAPSVFPFNPMASSSKDATSIFEDLQNVPVAGPLQRSVLRISNFGEIEAAQQNKAMNDAEKASLNLTLDDSTMQVKELARRANALVALYGKERESQMNKTEIKNSKLILSWAKKFPKITSELRNAEDSGNDALAKRLRADLQRMSDQTLAKLAEEPQ